MRIPFDINYKDEIIANKVKVVNEHDDEVRIICWNVDMYYPIVGAIAGVVRQYSKEGMCYNTTCSNLYIIVPDNNQQELDEQYRKGYDALKSTLPHWKLCEEQPQYQSPTIVRGDTLYHRDYQISISALFKTLPKDEK